MRADKQGDGNKQENPGAAEAKAGSSSKSDDAEGKDEKKVEEEQGSSGSWWNTGGGGSGGEGANTGNQNSSNQNPDTSSLMNMLPAIIGALLLAFSTLSTPSASDSAQEISFQEFKNELLEKGRVARIEVANKTKAKVYVADSGRVLSGGAASGGGKGAAESQYGAEGIEFGYDSEGEGGGAKGGSREERMERQRRAAAARGTYKYYFQIGSVESFERKLEDAQDAMGLDGHNQVRGRGVMGKSQP